MKLTNIQGTVGNERPRGRVRPGVFEFCYSTSTLYSAFQTFSVTGELSLPRPDCT